MIRKKGMRRSRSHRAYRAAGYPLLAFPPAILALAVGIGCGGAAFTTSDRSDGGTGSDASVTDVAAEAGTWCSTQASHQFCEDFDTLGLPAQFSENVTGGGMLAYDSVDNRSPPHSLLASAPPATTGPTNSTALLTRRFAHGTRFQLSAAFKIDIECLGGTDSVAPLALDFPSYRLTLVGTGLEATLLEVSVGGDGGPNQTPVSHPLKTSLIAGRWFSLTFDAQLGIAQAASMWIDGTPVLTNEKLALRPLPVSLMQPTLVVGASVASAPAGSPKGCGVHVDNITFDVTL
jgi:hypothetical protein